MIATLRQQLPLVREKYNAVISSTAEKREELWTKAQTLSDASSRYTDAWLGDWVEHPNAYRSNFKPTGQFVQLTEKKILTDLSTNTFLSLDAVTNELTPISQEFLPLREFILSELSFIRDLDSFKTEVALLDQVESFTWGMHPTEYIRSVRPKKIAITDPDILNQGLVTPPHIAVHAKIVYIISLLASYKNFEKLAHRLLRQLEIKTAESPQQNANSILQEEALLTIINKFHTVASQLRNRPQGQPAVIIKNEYDVQYVMNALLRLHFEDVRKEEYAPSMAGAPSRIDFLLKREQTLLEVKKTRSNLKDKEIGEELLIDIARYRSHPDCKRLVCFVYDPDNLITNPRGLEDDLNKVSTDNIVVEVYIRP